MALTKADRELLQATHDASILALALIKGTNGTGGIASHVDEHDHELEHVHGRIDESDQRHNKLSKNFWMLVGVLVGSGVIGGSIWGALG